MLSSLAASGVVVRISGFSDPLQLVVSTFRRQPLCSHLQGPHLLAKFLNHVLYVHQQFLGQNRIDVPKVILFAATTDFELK